MKRIKRKNDRGPRKFFFWKYDQFPYLKSGIGYLGDDGWATIPAYGNHMFFPVKVFDDLDEGRMLAFELERLAYDRIAILRTINMGFQAQLRLLAPWAAPVEKPTKCG
jgi:hypothetical protein